MFFLDIQNKKLEASTVVDLKCSKPHDDNFSKYVMRAHVFQGSYNQSHGRDVLLFSLNLFSKDYPKSQP
jgi:hypothetical protein